MKRRASGAVVRWIATLGVNLSHGGTPQWPCPIGVGAQVPAHQGVRLRGGVDFDEPLGSAPWSDPVRRPSGRGTSPARAPWPASGLLALP